MAFNSFKRIIFGLFNSSNFIKLEHIRKTVLSDRNEESLVFIEDSSTNKTLVSIMIFNFHSFLEIKVHYKLN